MRWGLCWYGQAALNRRDVGSIPTTATYGSHPAGSKAQPPTGREDEGLGRGS